MLRACTYQTPAGPLTVLANGGQQTAEHNEELNEHTDQNQPDVVVAAGFCSAEELQDRLPDPNNEVAPVADLGPLDDEIMAYLDGDLSALERIPVRQSGTDLQQQVWDGLRRIPAGQTRSYQEMAEATNNPRAVRAVASACGKNLIAPFVPCHRVVRTDGSLGGYVYGTEVKRWLLDHEA